MIYGEQSQPFEASYESAQTGLVGTVSMQVVDNQGNVVIGPSTATIIESPAGTGIYQATRTAPAAVGQFTVVWSLDGTYDPETVAIDDLLVYAAGADPNLPPLPPPAQAGGPTLGPCSAWTTTDEVEACSARVFDTAELDQLEDNITEASQLLFPLSGSRFSGTCDTTRRPCSTQDWCGYQVLSRGHVIGVGWGGTGWYDSRGPFCGCAPLSRVTLAGYPVRSIVEVKINGVVIDPTLYRLDGWRYLTRVRVASDDPAPMWPSCQALDLPDTEPGTFSVRYLYGIDPPRPGQRAAAELAYQLFLACDDSSLSECLLPAGVTSVTRQGVTFEMAPFIGWGRRNNVWNTGMRRVDAFLNAYNPNGLRRRPAVWSPDVPGYAQKLGT